MCVFYCIQIDLYACTLYLHTTHYDGDRLTIPCKLVDTMEGLLTTSTCIYIYQANTQSKGVACGLVCRCTESQVHCMYCSC